MINYLLAIFFPFVIFVKRSQPIRAGVALALQASGFLWFIAAIWALFGARKLEKITHYEEHLDELARKND
ncbi:hypothetical protein [Alicycliphilus denitrificans]|uniref:hypothetical protein n=1 Tax=Alicycliphilus denitrificans TaxID=179636 RepID=UPI0038514077